MLHQGLSGLKTKAQCPARRAPASPSQTPEALARAEGAERIAGVDEAGRGPWAGPVVAAAVVLPRGVRLDARIDDSKRLSPRQRQRAFDLIVAQADVGLGILAADAIDQRNILRSTLLAMSQAVHALRVPPELVLVDGNALPELDMPCRAVIGGDRSSYVIACASIVAKVVRDDLMAFYDAVHPHYGFGRHRGYGTARHEAQLRRRGPCALHRLSFRPVAERLHVG